MTTRTWSAPPAGPRISYAWNNPHNWTPGGVPQAGDTLRMAAGIMTMASSNLPAELRLGPAPNTLQTAAITLVMADSNATVGMRGNSTLLNYSGLDPGPGSAKLSIDATFGTDHLNADNISAVEGAVNIAANSDLVVTGKMSFAYAGHLEGATNGPGTRGMLTNNGTISIADGDISARVNGHGTIELHNYHDRTGVQQISAAIGVNQTVKLVAHTQDTRTELVHPESFKASLEIADAFNGRALGPIAKSNFLEIDGIHASRMDIRGDMLSLKGPGGRTLWQVHEHMPAGVTASMHNTAAGTEIVFTPHPLVG